MVRLIYHVYLDWTSSILYHPKLELHWVAGCHGQPGSLACFQPESWLLANQRLADLEEQLGKETIADLEEEQRPRPRPRRIHTPTPRSFGRRIQVISALRQHRPLSSKHTSIPASIALLAGWDELYLHQQTWPPAWMARPVSRSPSACALLPFARLPSLREQTMVPYFSEMALSRRHQLPI